MERAVTILLVAALLVSGFTGAVGVVAGQEGGETKSTPTATPSGDDEGNQSGGESNETTTPTSDAGDGQSATVEDLWKLYKESENAEQPSENKILKQIGPNLVVTDSEWDQSTGMAEVTFRAQVTTSIVITDSTGVFNGDNRGEKQRVQIPRGTYTLVVSATPDDTDPEYQAISIDPGDGYVYGLESKDTPAGVAIFDRSHPLWGWLIWFGLAVVAGGALSFTYRIRKMDTGTPYTSDGVKLPKNFQFGIEEIESEDEDDNNGDSK